MQLSITLISPDNKPISLPIHYNHLLQGFIYRHLHRSIAQSLHQYGFPLEKRTFKLFTFSRIFGKRHRDGNSLIFDSPITFHIASPYDKFLESFAELLVRAEKLNIARNPLILKSVQVEFPPKNIKFPLMIGALSPITTYSTLSTPDGRKKTYYYTPWEKEFAEQIFTNLIKKYLIIREKFPKKFINFDSDFGGSDIKGIQQMKTKIAEMNFALKPVKVSNRDEKIIIYKGTIIKGWTGIYELTCPTPLIHVAYETGIGSKNPQGLGMIKILSSGEKG